MDRIYKYNPDAIYKPNGGTYLQLITAKDLYIQNITVAEHDGHSDSFLVKFTNVFTNYPLGAVRVEDQKFKDWDHYKFTLWQSQLNFAVFCASSACGVSVEHLNAKEPVIRSIHRFHVYYHIRRILKILEIPLPYENSFNQHNNNQYNHKKFIGICSEYGVSNDLTKWRNQKYFSTWQSKGWVTGKPGMSHINENSFSRWIIEKSNGLTKVGLEKSSESVRDYAYLILTTQTIARAQIIGHEARNLDAQRVFLNDFENIINRRVDISEDIQRFQKTLQYARSKVDYAIAEYVYFLPSNMNLRIGKIRRYNNKILIASPSFKIGTNLKINIDEEKGKPDVKSNKEHKQDTKHDIKIDKECKQDVKPNIECKQDVTKPDTNEITYEEEKVALVLGITSIFTVLWMFK